MTRGYVREDLRATIERTLSRKPGADPARVLKLVETVPERVDGYPEPTERPMPEGAQSVCVACWRIFGGVTAFDTHQTLDNGVVVCHDPASKGMRVSRTRKSDGLPVWSKKSPTFNPYVRRKAA